MLLCREWSLLGRESLGKCIEGLVFHQGTTDIVDHDHIHSFFLLHHPGSHISIWNSIQSSLRWEKRLLCAREQMFSSPYVIKFFHRERFLHCCFCPGRWTHFLLWQQNRGCGTAGRVLISNWLTITSSLCNQKKKGLLCGIRFPYRTRIIVCWAHETSLQQHLCPLSL